MLFPQQDMGRAIFFGTQFGSVDCHLHKRMGRGKDVVKRKAVVLGFSEVRDLRET